MKTLILVVLAFFAEISANAAIGQLPIGSSNVVETYNFTNSTFADATVKWTRTNGVTVYWFGGTNIPSMNKTQLCLFNQQFLANQLRISVESDPQADRSKPVTLGAVYGNPNCPYWALSTRSQTITYSIAPTAIGSPDLSKINPYGWEYGYYMTFKNLRWARFEVVETNNPSQLCFLMDSRTINNPPSAENPNTIEKDSTFSWGCLGMSVPFACSGTNGAYRVKTYMVSGANNDYEIFDSNGSRVAETPLAVMNLVISTSTVKLDVVGGDVGRVFVVEKSVDLLNWRSCVGTTNVMGSRRICHITMPKGNENRLFFRTKALSLDPSTIPAIQLSIESLRITSDVQFEVVGGNIGDKFVVEKSVDLRLWTPFLATNTVVSGMTHITLPKGLESQAYFRTKSVQ